MRPILPCPVGRHKFLAAASFIFNHELLMIGVVSLWHGAAVAGATLLAMLLFVPATRNHFLVRSRWYETAALLLVAFTLFRPGYWMDMLAPPYREVAAHRIFAAAGAEPPNGYLRVRVVGESLTGRDVEKTVRVPLGAEGDGRDRLRRAGLTVRVAEGKAEIAAVAFGSTARKLGLDTGWEIKAVEVRAERPAKQWMWLPALALLGVVVALQLARRRTAMAVGPPRAAPAP